MARHVLAQPVKARGLGEGRARPGEGRAMGSILFEQISPLGAVCSHLKCRPSRWRTVSLGGWISGPRKHGRREPVEP